MQLIILAQLNEASLLLEDTENLIKEAYAHAVINGAGPGFYEELGVQQQKVCDKRQLIETLKLSIASRN